MNPQVPAQRPRGSSATALLSFIRGAETRQGYQDYSDFAKKVGAHPPKPITQMTVSEVEQWQRQAAKRGAKSVAVGGYQMIGKTFREVKGSMGLNGDELFDEALQDRMGQILLNRRGYGRWASGRMTDEQFMDSLANEWAGLPMATGPKRGRSRYAGDGLNGATRSNGQFINALGASRRGDNVDLSMLENITTTNLPAPGNYTGADMSQFRGPNPSFTSRLDEFNTQQSQPEKPGLLEAAGAAISDEWTTSWLLAQAGREEFKPDDNFSFDDESFAAVTEGLNAAYHQDFENATSAAHANAIRDQLLKSQEIDQKLGSLGWTGVGLRIGAALTDPVAIAVSIGTEGLAAPLIYGEKVSRVGRALRAGAAAGATNAGLEGYLVSQDATRDADGIMYAAAGGFVLGGAFGALRRIPEDALLEKPMREIMDEKRRAITPFGAVDETSSVGAAQSDGTFGTPMSPAEFQQANALNSPKSAFGKVRYDMVGALKQSENDITRRVAGFLAEDAVGNADGSAVTRGASENVARDMRVRMTRFYRDADASYAGWRKARGIKPWSLDGRKQFFEEVSKAKRRPIDAAGDPHVNKVVSRMQTEMNDLLKFAKEQGLKGFDDVAENDQYLNRQWSIRSLDTATEQFTDRQVRGMIASSLKSGHRKASNLAGGVVEEMDDEDAFAIAKALLKSIRGRKYSELDMNRALNGSQKEVLQEMLKEADLPLDQITRITDRVGAKDGDGSIARGKYRLRLDETMRTELTDAAGVRHEFGVEELFENNAELLMQSYTRQVLGAGYMEEALANFKVPNLDGDLPDNAPSWETVKAHIAENSKMSPAKQKAEFRKLDTLYKAVSGIPQSEATLGTEGMRLMRDYNFTRVMGQVGVAQLAEIGNIVGQAGLRTTLQGVPGLRRIFANAKTGKFSDDLLDEMEGIWGFGTDFVRATPSVHVDEYARVEGLGLNTKVGERADFALQQAKQTTAVASGMAHINMALQRFAGRAAVQKFMNMASGGTRLSQSRFAAMGLSEAMTERVMGQLNKHVNTSQGLMGRTVRRLNADMWDDEEARAAFINAIDRWSRKIIQENDVGNMPAFMTTEMGKTLFQFRSFMLAAYSKQLLSGMHHRDWVTASSFMISMFFGGLFYVGQQYVNSLGRPDRDGWLEERLSPESVAKASFQRAGFSSLVPPAMDQASQLAGNDPVFNFRTTDLAGTVLGNPSADLFFKAQQGLGGVVAASVNPTYDYSQRDHRALMSLLPFQNAFIVRNFISMMGQDLPRYSN